tara:strand:- start:3111 stop:12080 length:8970 start_codon:yes stop_codon:yes gene_type:complete
MPLPEDYYDILDTGDKPLTTPLAGEQSSLYPDLISDEEVLGSAWGGVGDFLWAAGGGFVSGTTWGVTDLMDVTGQEAWEDMSGSEKAGWILGEGASFFTPFGPFGAMAKGSRALIKGTKSANQFVGKAAKKAGEEAADTFTANFAKLSKKEAKAVLKAQGKGVKFEDDIIEGLNAISKDELGIQWLKNLRATGDVALEASDNLVASGTNAVMKAFEAAKIPIRQVDASKIANEWVERLGRGEYVNDVAEWVTRGLAGRIPDTATGFLSKYLGMAAQDMMMMGTHGLIAGKIGSLANGEDFDASGALSHAALMSLGFPLIRKIPWGGTANVSTGIKAYMSSFKNTNYEAIGKKHGDQVVKNLLRLMVTGSKKDLLSRSDLGTAFWKAGGIKYKNMEAVVKALPEMKVADSITLLNKINKKVNSELVKNWGSAFLKDTVASLPRMGVGVLAMNPWVVNKDAWGSMEGPELASHLFMAAAMTKGRGAWGHAEQRAHFADFTPYHEALHLLRVDTSNLESVLRFHDGKSIYEGMGAALNQSETGQAIIEIFDRNIKNASPRPAGKDYSNPDHALVMEFHDLYNVMKKFSDDGFSPRKTESMDEKTLNNIANELNALQFGDGTTVAQNKFAGSLVKLTGDTANKITEVYKRMLQHLSDEMGYDIGVTKDGKVVGKHVESGQEGKPIDDADTVNRILDGLESIDPNNITIDTGKLTKYERIAKAWITKQAKEGKTGLTEEDFNLRTREIIDEYMNELGAAYGDKLILRDPVGREGEPNPLFQFLKQAKSVEASERVYNIITGKFPETDISGDSNLTKELDRLFQLSDGRYGSSIDVYKGLMKGLVKDPKTDKEIKANENIINNIEDLRYLFELRKGALGGTSKVDPREKGEIDVKTVESAKGKWKAIHGGLAQGWKVDWIDHTKRMYLERMYKARGFDRRAVNLLSFMHDHNLILPGDPLTGKISIVSEKLVIDELKDRGTSKKDLAEYRKAFKTIKQVLGEDIVQEVTWSYTESGKRQVDEVDISDFIKAAKLLGNHQFTDLLTTTQSVLDKLSFSEEGSRNRVHQLYSKITTLIDYLDPTNDKRPLVDPIKQIKDLVIELEGLEKIARTKETQEDISEAIGQLSLVTAALDKSTGKFKITDKKILTKEEQASGDAFGIHTALTEPLQMRLDKIYKAEMDGIDKLQQLVVKLEQLSTRGAAGLGLNKAESQKVIEDLSKEMYDVLRGKKGKGVKLLSEVIQEVNEKGFFGDAIKVIESINDRVNRIVILNREHHPLNQDGIRMAESLEKGHKIHEHHRTVTEILKDYGLVDKDGKIEESFRDAVALSPRKALIDNVRDKIYEQKDKTRKQKKAEWDKFKSRDALEILNNIENSKPINRVKIIGAVEDGTKRAILQFDNNSPHIQHPNTIYFEQKGYKIHLLDDTMSVDTDGRGRLRNVSLSSFKSPHQIQTFLNEALMIDKNVADILEGFKTIDPGLKESDLKKMLKNPDEWIFYLRLSPMDKVMFVATDKNLKILDSDFESWYKRTKNRFRGKNQQAFVHLFEHLLTKPNNARHIVELKMMLPYLTKLGKRNMFKDFIKEYAGDIKGVGGRPKALAKLQANMFKRGFLSDGGTTQPMSTNVLNWAKNNHPDASIRDQAKLAIDKGGFVYGLLGDGVAENNKSHPLNIENIELGQLQVIGNQASDFIRDIASVQERSLDGMPSLMNSLLDGGKFASEGIMKLVMAQKGMLNNDFSDSANGAKTIIFAMGDNQLLGKGYLIYHPDIAAQMPADVDILLGRTSAKDFDGKNINGTKVELFDLSQAGRGDWMNTLGNMSGENKMLLPIESLGVSFTSKNTTGVAISPSIFDFQSPGVIDKAIVWMGFEAKLQQIGIEWNTVHKDGAKLANWLYDTSLREGNPLDKGDTGLSKLLFEYGAMPNNPLVQKALRRLLRSSNYKHLSKAPNQRGGEDNFIVPNIDGKLSVPVYVELYKEAGKQIDRVTANFGGIALNKNTANRSMGNGEGGNLEGETFAFRDSNGVDVLLSIVNGEVQTHSNFYDKAGVNVKYKGTLNGNDVYKDTRLLKLNSESRIKAEAQIKSLMRKVRQWNLNLEEVSILLEGGNITKTNTRGRQVSFHLPNRKPELNMQVAVGAHAVPVVGHDKVIFRVQKILQNMDGLTEVNVHDLRTVMQRDNDGDHLFTHTRLPWELFKTFADENGRKDDFRMFNRDDVLDANYINIFGIGVSGKGFSSDGKAGDLGEQTGFQQYANRLHTAKMMTGQVIGARNALSWLNKLGFQMGGKQLMKDLISDNDMTSDAWKVLDKFYDTTQNALDIHGGIHEAISSEQKLKDFLFFGETDQFTGPTGDPVFDKHNKPGLNFFDIPTFGKTRLQKEMFYEILRTLKKSNMIQNDTWDEAGSRAPEPFELRNAYYDMRHFFSNPTQYLSKKMARRIRGIQGPEQALLKAQFAKEFYGDTIDFKKLGGKAELYKHIIKGTAIDGDIKFSFSNIPVTNVESAFDKSIGGHLIKELLKTNGFWDHNYQGLSMRSEEVFNRAGFFVKNIESLVETARMFGDDPADLQLGDVTINSFGVEKASPEITKALNNGILKELLQRQHRNVMGTLEYFRAERFSNDTKVEKLQRRLGNLQEAMNIMDVQIANNMVIDRPQTQIHSASKVKRDINFSWVDKGREVSVYKVKGDVSAIDPENAPNVSKYQVDGLKLDYGKLQFIGNYTNKSQPLKMQDGFSYIVDKNPKKRISQSSNEARYSNAMFKATYADDVGATPEKFLKDGNPTDFRDDTRRLRAQISMDYIKTVQEALSNKVLSEGIFALEQIKEGRALNEYIRKWIDDVDSSDPYKVLLRYLLQPQITSSYFYRDAQNNEVPAYKTNDHLFKMVLQWSEDNGQSKFVKELVKDVEHYASGKGTEIDITSYDRGTLDRFDYSVYGDMANSVRTLAKHLNLNFADPMLNDMLNDVIDKRRSPIEEIKLPDGTLVPIRKGKPEKDSYWQIATDQTGEGC